MARLGIGGSKAELGCAHQRAGLELSPLGLVRTTAGAEGIWGSAARKLGMLEAGKGVEQGLWLPTPICSPRVALALMAALRRTWPKCWYQKGQSQEALEEHLPQDPAVWGGERGLLLISAVTAVRYRSVTNSSSSSATPHGKAPAGFYGARIWKLLVLTSFFPKAFLVLLRSGAGENSCKNPLLL